MQSKIKNQCCHLAYKCTLTQKEPPGQHSTDRAALWNSTISTTLLHCRIHHLEDLKQGR